jgi:MinD-like ATPase involved in chromosome partitioning or flagellar assembly
VTFDKVLPELVFVCEQSAIAARATMFCVARDPRGRVRVAIQVEDSASDLPPLQTALEQALGGYFAGPLIATDQRPPNGVLARQVIELATSFDTSGLTQPISGQPIVTTHTWKKLEARLSKLDWLEETVSHPPWPLVAQRPRVVTFYSFKGGVGRTTALAATAWQLASEGRQVAVIDLDLEAPGVGALLGADADLGVLDFIVDHVATGSADVEPISATAFGADAERVRVYGAGRLSAEYLEKLARLDFTSHSFWSKVKPHRSPVSVALRALLSKAADREPKPDYILVDSRAGLHDLSGLSLHGLAHLDVFLAAANEQSYRGLELTLRVAVKRRSADDLSCVIVHALAPPKGNPEAIAEEAEFRQRSYGIFQKFVYVQEEADNAGSGVPSLDSTIDAHSPWVIRRNEALQRFALISDRKEDLFRADYVALRQRIEELTEPEEAEP